MLENMFVGDPPGNYDRLLDVSRAVTGGLFFVPTASWLDDLAATVVETPKTGDAPLRGIDAETNSKPSTHDGSLRIGSLKDAG